MSRGQGGGGRSDQNEEEKKKGGKKRIVFQKSMFHVTIIWNAITWIISDIFSMSSIGTMDHLS